MMKTESNFTFKFNGITDLRSSEVEINDHAIGTVARVRVSVSDTDFLNRRGLQQSTKIADIADLAVAIGVADRYSKQSVDYPRKIHVDLPVRQAELYQSDHVRKLLRSALHWLTGDIWKFEFRPLGPQRRRSELQRTMLESSNQNVLTEVALWSGGLDAFAGLCNRIREREAERFLLLAEGTNSPMKGVQDDVYQALNEHLSGGVDIQLVRVATIKEAKSGKGFLHPNGAMRARGFVFMLIGSAYALLERQHQLAVYENGIGALNLPFRASEVGLDHSLSVHPLSLHYVSELVSALVGEPFKVHNPFLWWTKGEMCRVLEVLNLVDIAAQTVSCDRRLRKKDSVPHCGRCSSCILRRQSLLAAGIEDRTPYQAQREYRKSSNRLLANSHLPHMMYQVSQLEKALKGQAEWSHLALLYPTRLADLAFRFGQSKADRDAYIDNILSLFRRYVSEWNIPNVAETFVQERQDISRAMRLEKAKKVHVRGTA